MEIKFKKLTVYRDYGSVSIEEINTIEDKIGFCFPDTYKELLNIHGGARLEEEDFDFINKRGEEDGRDVSFFYFNQLLEEQEHLNDPVYYGVPGLVSFASTAEGDTMCFDYREDAKTCEPKIILLIHDEYENTNGVDHMKIEYIANTFDDFLDMLYEYKDDDI